MREMQTTVTDVQGICQSVCLSRGSSRFHCTKMAKQVKMLFRVNTHGAQETLCSRWVLNHKEGKGPTFEFWDPLISP